MRDRSIDKASTLADAAVVALAPVAVLVKVIVNLTTYLKQEKKNELRTKTYRVVFFNFCPLDARFRDV